MKPLYVFGDSHSRCFQGHARKVFTFAAASAKGLNNQHSASHTHQKILDAIQQLPQEEEEEASLLFFFGKVDMDFTLHYKYNQDAVVDYPSYIHNIVHSYIRFLTTVAKAHPSRRILVCEIPMPHIVDDDDLVKIINIESHIDYINSHLGEKEKVSTEGTCTKVFPCKTRIYYYFLFNEELQKQCLVSGFRFLEINKNFEWNCIIPPQYLPEHKLDHHLKDCIGELYMKELLDSASDG
uniref:SGNH domain-containing protein n=1 Tax=viral metagenome TaxID=1070528 RepID=A0A6C0K3Q8_9ZZZZ